MKITDEQLIADARECVRIMRETNTFPTGKGVLSDIADRLEALTQPSGKVSDEQVERAVERWFLGEDVADFTDEMKSQWRDDMRAALEAALPHLSQGAVRVKPLEWKELSTGWIAHTSFHAYEVVKTDHGFMATYANRDFAWGAEDAMKAAAQADHERRIMSTLSPAPVGVTDEMVLKFITTSRDEDAGYQNWTEAVTAGLNAALASHEPARTDIDKLGAALKEQSDEA